MFSRAVRRGYSPRASLSTPMRASARARRARPRRCRRRTPPGVGRRSARRACAASSSCRRRWGRAAPVMQPSAATKLTPSTACTARALLPLPCTKRRTASTSIIEAAPRRGAKLAGAGRHARTSCSPARLRHRSGRRRSGTACRARSSMTKAHAQHWCHQDRLQRLEARRRLQPPAHPACHPHGAAQPHAGR